MIQGMAEKNYSVEFRRQAVDLYESTPGATIAGISRDLGVERTSLQRWLKRYGTGRRTAADGTATTAPRSTTRTSLRDATGAPPGVDPSKLPPETPEQELARLRARVAELEASEKKLTAEREILRSAAKYFAGETDW